MKKICLIIIIFLSFLLLLIKKGAVYAQMEAPFISRFKVKPTATKEIVVTFKKRPTTSTLLALLRQNSMVEAEYGLSETNSMVFSVKEGNISQAVTDVFKSEEVEVVFPNYHFYPLVIPNDAYLMATPNPGQGRLQWNMFNLKLADQDRSAWDVTSGSSSVVAAVIDTGIDSSHPDLSGKIASLVDCVSSCKEVSSMSDDPQMPHGTHVSGLLAAATNNSLGIAGSGYNTKIMMIKVMNENGEITLSSVKNGIKWAVEHGAKVINLSLGAIEENLDSLAIEALKEAISNINHDGAWDKGVVIIAAAGNCGNNTQGDDACAILDQKGNPTGRFATNPKTYPAALPNVIAVAALDTDNRLTDYSEHNDSSKGKIGEWISVAAPGGDCSSQSDAYKCILSTIYSSSGKYGFMAGTSQASPQVAGVVALLLAVRPSLTNESVRQILFDTANKNIAQGGNATKYGMVDAMAAVNAASSAVTPSPTQSVTATPGSISPTPTTGSISPTPTPKIANCNQTCLSAGYQCTQGLRCVQLTDLLGSDKCRNPQCPEVENCQCVSTPSPHPTNQPRLPKTPPSPYPSPPYCSSVNGST